MPAASACFVGAMNAFASVNGMAMPSALALIAVWKALTISVTTPFSEPVQLGWARPSRLAASFMPLCVGAKKELVVTWLMKANFHAGVFGKSPIVEAVPVLRELPQAA